MKRVLRESSCFDVAQEIAVQVLVRCMHERSGQLANPNVFRVPHCRTNIYRNSMCIFGMQQCSIGFNSSMCTKFSKCLVLNINDGKWFMAQNSGKMGEYNELHGR